MLFRSPSVSVSRNRAGHAVCRAYCKGSLLFKNDLESQDADSRALNSAQALLSARPVWAPEASGAARRCFFLFQKQLSRLLCSASLFPLSWAQSHQVHFALVLDPLHLFHLVSLLCCLVQFTCSVVSDSLRPHELQHARPPCPSPTPRVHSDSCPSSG